MCSDIDKTHTGHTDPWCLRYIVHIFVWDNPQNNGGDAVVFVQVHMSRSRCGGTMGLIASCFLPPTHFSPPPSPSFLHLTLPSSTPGPGQTMESEQVLLLRNGIRGPLDVWQPCTYRLCFWNEGENAVEKWWNKFVQSLDTSGPMVPRVTTLKLSRDSRKDWCLDQADD